MCGVDLCNSTLTEMEKQNYTRKREHTACEAANAALKPAVDDCDNPAEGRDDDEDEDADDADDADVDADDEKEEGLEEEDEAEGARADGVGRICG
jgi:hypothetical protein